jgi:antitoxin ParD1/3/4
MKTTKEFAMATMNISLPDKMKKWIEKQVKSGDFSNSSDYVRDVLRQAKERQEVIAEIQDLLDVGEKSGFEPYDRAAIEDRLGISKRKRRAA